LWSKTPKRIIALPAVELAAATVTTRPFRIMLLITLLQPGSHHNLWAPSYPRCH